MSGSFILSKSVHFTLFRPKIASLWSWWKTWKTNAQKVLTQRNYLQPLRNSMQADEECRVSIRRLTSNSSSKSLAVLRWTDQQSNRMACVATDFLIICWDSQDYWMENSWWISGLLMGKKPTEVEGREMKPDTPLKAGIPPPWWH